MRWLGKIWSVSNFQWICRQSNFLTSSFSQSCEDKQLHISWMETILWNIWPIYTQGHCDIDIWYWWLQAWGCNVLGIPCPTIPLVSGGPCIISSYLPHTFTSTTCGIRTKVATVNRSLLWVCRVQGKSVNSWQSSDSSCTFIELVQSTFSSPMGSDTGVGVTVQNP